METPRFAVLDVETTGFGRADRIVEVGVVLLSGSSGQVEDEFDTLVNPCRDIGATHVHGITPGMVAAAPTFEEIASPLAHIIDGAVLVAHNLPFDQRFVLAEFERAGIELDPGAGICTLRLSGEKLTVACARRGIAVEEHHRALADARATSRLLLQLLEQVEYARPLHVTADVPMAIPRTLRRDALQGSVLPIVHPAPRMPYPSSSDRSMAYLNVLDSYLDDLVLSTTETDSLRELAAWFDIDNAEQSRLYAAYMEVMVAAAWRDGLITSDEQGILSRIAEAIGVDPGLVPDVSQTKSMGSLEGARVCFTGSAQLDGVVLDRGTLEALAARHGLQPVSAVTKKGCDLLVASDVVSMSGKAKKARDFGIPVMSVDEFMGKLS